MATVDFQQYLQTLLTSPNYQQWQESYAETDATSPRQANSSPRSSHQVNLNLMVKVLKSGTAPSKRMSLNGKTQIEEEEETVEPIPVLEALQKYAPEQVLLVGQPGSGKSTTLEQLLWQQAQAALENPALKIPVFVELRSYQCSTLDCIRDSLAEYGLDLSQGQIEELLALKKLLLLFDGWNELPSEEAKQEVAAFRKQYPVAAIFTSRELSSGANLGIKKRLEMQPLSEPQIEEFVLAYLPETGDKLLQKLAHGLETIRRTPLFLGMLCQLFEEGEKVPKNLGELFHCFTIQHNSNQEDVKVKLELRDRAPKLLQTLAVAMMQGKTRLDLRLETPFWEAQKVLAQALQQQGDQPNRAREWLDGLLSYHRVLLETDRFGEKGVRFCHQLIQEYYGAQWLLEQLETLDDDRLKDNYLNYLKWTAAIAMMLNLLDNREQAIRVIRLALEVDLQLGARLAGEVQEKFQPDTVKMVRECKVPKQVKLLCFNRVLVVGLPNLIAIKLLEKTNSAEAIKFLTQALKDSDPRVREIAAEALGKLGNEQAVEALVKTLNHSNSSMRRIAAEALGKLESKQPVEALVKALQDTDFWVRRKAAAALGKSQNEQAVEALVKALGDSDFWVRASAAEALGKLGSTQAVVPLIQAIEDSNFWVLRKATEALGKLGSEQGVAALIKAFNHSVRKELLESAGEALGKLGSEQALAPLVEALHDCDSTQRWIAATVLGKLGNEQALAYLEQALQDSDSEVRQSAAEALGRLGSEQAVVPLMQALQNTDSRLRGKAAETLGKLGNEQAVAPLMQALQDPNSGVRGKAAEALGKLGSEQAVAPLMQALQDTDFAVRERAVEALGKIADPEILPHLMEWIPTEIGTNVLDAIAAIQEHCQFYNYEIDQYFLSHFCSTRLQEHP